ncbi:DNA polymerase III subunit delta [Candidatus Providencia siddallii]|uniref:DNA polymerase III subunit delta n=1 Tax=Candidatus Providencia siddallii TaxID=1715285 RepID=A0A0M6W884_9GAMM|nr:DNA polymerase III subunit delta [Candidatus Providencia siddallii]
MIYINYEQLISSLKKTLKNFYIICSEEYLFIQDSIDNIRNTAKLEGFKEHSTFFIEKNTDWNIILSLCNTFSLFSHKKTLTLIFHKNNLNSLLYEKINQLIKMIHQKLILILCCNKIIKFKKNNILFKSIINKNCIYVNCLIPEYKYLPQLVNKIAYNMKLSLEKEACQLLCYCYEGNLLELKQVLELLTIIYPYGKLTYSCIKTIINDSSYFTSYNLINAILKGNSYRAYHILKKLEQENVDPLILLRNIQKELILLLTFKRQLSYTSLKSLFDEQKIWQRHRFLLKIASQRISLDQLQYIFMLLTKIELNIKKNITNFIWLELQSLSVLICKNNYKKDFYSCFLT